jgi:outer membrane protein assembly factor BamB
MVRRSSTRERDEYIRRDKQEALRARRPRALSPGLRDGDNVASRPVVAGDTVVFGGESRNVYGLDAGTGEEI